MNSLGIRIFFLPVFLVLSIVAESANNADLLTLSKELYNNGEYSKALDLAEQAVAESGDLPSAERTAIIAFRDYLAESFEILKDFKRVNSRYFAFSYINPKDSILAYDLFAMLDSVRLMLKRDTGFVSDTVVLVEVFPDKSTFAKVSENYSYETLRGLAPVTSKFKRLMFVSPRATLRGYRWREALCREYEYLVTGRVNEIISEARVVPSSSHGPIFTEDGEIESGSTLQSRYVRLAGKLMKEKRKSAAVKELERAEKAMGGYATSWLLLQLAVLYLENGDDNSALSTIEKAIEQYPDDSNVYFKRAEIYLGKGNAALTIKSARHALEINPFHTYARELLILSLEMTNPASPELNRHKQIAGYLYRYK